MSQNFFFAQEPRPRRARVRGAVLTALLAGAALPSTARAATYIVDRTDDGTQSACSAAANDCTLRGAIIAANTNAGADTIELAANTSYTLTLGGSDSGINARVPATGDLDITDALTINGHGATVNGGGIDRVFDIGNGGASAFAVTMNDLTVSGGVAQGVLSFGGGINVRSASLILNRCTVSGNSSGDFNGGGLAVNSVQSAGQTASLSLNQCTIEGNTGYNGGGLVAGSASVSVNQSLFNNNTANGTSGGGALFVTGSAAQVNLTNSTLTGNTSASNGGGLAIYAGTVGAQHVTIAGNALSGGGRGGGIDNGAGFGGTLNFDNSVLAGNTGGDGAGALSGSYNLIQSAAELAVSGSNNITGQDPKLNALADNTGPTRTLLPQTGSPLIDKAGTSALAVDQRGAARPYDFAGVANASGGNGSDIGAVEAQNLAPTLNNKSVDVNEDAPFTFAANSFDTSFSDANGDTLQSVRIVSLPSNGTLFFDGVAATAGQTVARAELPKLRYVPGANFNGTDSFVFNASDGTLFAAQNATLTFNVAAVNDAPSFAVGANQSVSEDAGAQSVANFATNISAGPANESTQTLTFTVTNTNNALFASQPAIGADGTLTYTPAANAFGTATVSVTLRDNGGGADTSAVQTFTITVNPVNDAPSFSVGANQTVSEDAGAQTVNGFATNISAGPANESGQTLTFNVTNTNNALFATQPTLSANGTLTYTPAADASGTATVSVTLRDNGGGADTSATQTFTITVNPVNDAPVISKIADQTIDEDTATGALAFTIGDVDNAVADLSVTATSSNPALVPVSNIVINGSGANRTVTITPVANASGTTTIALIVSDGALNSSTTFLLTVNAVNDAPTISALADQTINEDDATGAQTFIIGDIDNAIADLNITATSSDSALVPVANIVFGGSGANRTVTVTPAANANGKTTITIQVSDGTATAKSAFDVQVNPVNDAPSFAIGANQSVNEDAGAQTVSGFATNISAGPANESTQTLTFNVSNTNNALFANQPTIGADGTLTYTPAADASGTVTVSVQLRDDGGTYNGGVDTSATQTFTITVNPVNDAPVAVADSYGTAEDIALTVSAAEGVLKNDSDVDNIALRAVLESGAAHGTLTLNADGSFTYVPDADFNGSDSFTYRANDGALDSNLVTVTIAVGAVNDAPVAASQTVTTQEDTAKALTLGASDAEGAALAYRVVTPPSNGTLSGTAPNLTYTPKANFNGNDSFTFVANDGALDSNLATISIVVSAVNDAPVAGADAYAVDQNTTLTVSAANGVLKNDRDVDNATLSAILDANVAHGTLTLNSDGGFTYVPIVGYRGQDSFRYHASDGQLKSAIVTVNLTVNATPQPINFGVSLTPKAPATNSLLTATPIILDASDVSFSYAWSVNGVVQQSGPRDSFDLGQPGYGDKGDRVSVVVTAKRGIDGGTATNFVQVFNSAPFAFSQTGAANASVPTSFTLRGADLDAETLAFKRVGGPTNGTADIVNNADGTATLTYTGRADFNGVEVIRFVSVDESGRTSTPATLAINVTRVAPPAPPNRAPFANNVTASTRSGVEVAIPLNGTDPDGDALSFKRVGGPSNGSGEIRLDRDGVYKMFYTPRAGFVGNEIIRFVALDSAGKPSPVATMTINVTSARGALQSAPSGGNS